MGVGVATSSAAGKPRPLTASASALSASAPAARVFGVDVLKCSRCQGKMRLIACIEEPDVAKKILESSTSACELKRSRPCGPGRRL